MHLPGHDSRFSLTGAAWGEALLPDSFLFLKLISPVEGGPSPCARPSSPGAARPPTHPPACCPQGTSRSQKGTCPICLCRLLVLFFLFWGLLCWKEGEEVGCPAQLWAVPGRDRFSTPVALCESGSWPCPGLGLPWGPLPGNKAVREAGLPPKRLPEP